MTSRGGRSSQPFQVSFTIENGQLQALKRQIINCNNFLMNLGVLSCKLNDHETLNFNQFNVGESSQSVLQSPIPSNPNSNPNPSLLESQIFSGIPSLPRKEAPEGQTHLKRDAAKLTPWKEEPAFRVPYPPHAVAQPDEKMADHKNGVKAHEKSFAYPTTNNSNPPIAEVNNINNGMNNTNNINNGMNNINNINNSMNSINNVNNINNSQQFGGVVKGNRQSKKRKAQNETQPPYYHLPQSGYPQFPCRDLNPQSFDQMFKVNMQHQVFQQQRMPEANKFYNYPFGIAGHQMYMPHFQSDHAANLSYGSGNNGIHAGMDCHSIQIGQLLEEEAKFVDIKVEDERKDDDKFMDADSLARLIDSGEELPFSDCLDDLDNLLDFDLPEDLSVFETGCDPPNGNFFRILSDDLPAENRSEEKEKSTIENGDPIPSPGYKPKTKGRKRARDDKVKFPDELDQPGKKLSLDKSRPSFLTKATEPSRSKQEVVRNCDIGSKDPIVRSLSQPFGPSEKASKCVAGPPVRSPGVTFSTHPLQSSATGSVSSGLNPLAAQSCVTPSSTQYIQHNFSPSIASDSDGSPRLSTDDDRSSSGGKTASLLSPPNWASDVSAPSGLEFYENSAFPRNDMQLSAEVGFTV